MRTVYRVGAGGLVILLVLIAAMIVAAHSPSGVIMPLTQPNSTLNNNNTSASSYGGSSTDYGYSTTTSSSSSVASTSVPPPPTTTTPLIRSLPPQKSTGISVAIFSSYSASQQKMVNEIIQTKQQYPTVPFIVVINPSDGPGNYSSNISSEVKNMQNVKVAVLGYVPTTWATKNLSEVKSEISTYHNWYHVDGILIDQIPNWLYNGPQGQPYYSGPNGSYIPDYLSNITSYAKSLGMSKVVADAGTDIPQSFVGSVSVFGIFENQFLPPIFSSESDVTALAGANAWHLAYNKSNFYFVSYNVQSLNPYYVAAASDYVSYLYMTNGTGTQPYNSLPPYFKQLVATLASLVPIKIQSELSNGTSINPGLWATVTQSDGNSSSGYAPFTFNMVSGSTVTITADTNNSSYTFDHWSNGETNSTIQITTTKPMNLTAYYT